MNLGLDSKLAEDVCFRLCRWLFGKRSKGESGARESTFDDAAYWDWRSAELREQYTRFFSDELIRDKDVVDFGCGAGHLCFYIAEHSPKSITGLELVEHGVKLANQRLKEQPLNVPTKFIHSTSDEVIDLPDNSVDVILCFDVLEHILKFRPILSEWQRILRPGGRVLIWWIPWFNPWGPHIESLVPLPWAHTLFSERVLIKTCARIRDMDDYVPRVWDFDSDGSPLPNKWHTLQELPEVNRLTIRQFESALSEEDIRIESREVTGFSGSITSRFVGFFARFPVLREYLSSCITYVLQKK